MSAIDLKKQLKHLYQASANEITEVEVPSMNYLMMDGAGDPNASTYSETVAKLFAVAYTLKFMLKKRDAALDYSVMPLEGLWWTQEGTLWYATDRADWRWTAIIMQPETITSEMFEQARYEVEKRSSSTSPRCALRRSLRAELPRFYIPALTARKSPPSTAYTLLLSSSNGHFTASITRST